MERSHLDCGRTFCMRLHISVEGLLEFYNELPSMNFGGRFKSDSEGVDGNYWWERYLRHTSPEGITNQKGVSGKVILTGGKRSSRAPADSSWTHTPAMNRSRLGQASWNLFPLCLQSLSAGPHAIWCVMILQENLNSSSSRDKRGRNIGL